MAILQWSIAAVTAILVAGVAFLQWRTAQQKAVLDLFERRHEIYETVRKAVSTMISNPNAFDQARELELLQAMERAYFFFGDDVVSYLEQLWSAIMEVCGAEREMRDLADQVERSAVVSRRRASMNRIQEFHRIGKPLFAKYMRFSQKVPANA